MCILLACQMCVSSHLSRKTDQNKRENNLVAAGTTPLKHLETRAWAKKRGTNFCGTSVSIFCSEMVDTPGSYGMPTSA